MKNKFILPLITATLFAGVLVLAQIEVGADAKRIPGVVVLSAIEVYPDNGNYSLQVFAVSSGANSPKINNGADLAQTLEYLKGLGYKITPSPTYNTFYCERE